MKKDIQPKVYKTCTVTCACGNTFTTISTVESIHVDVCSQCHPFYTGTQRFVDTAGRIEKFQKKMELAKERASKRKAKTQQKQRKSETRKTLKEMLAEAEKLQETATE